MKKPTLCKAKQNCKDCNAYVTKDDTVYRENGYDVDVYEVCAFKHYKASNKNEKDYYDIRLKQYMDYQSKGVKNE